MDEESRRVVKMVDTRQAIETLKEFVQAIFKHDEDLAVSLVAVGKTAEMFLEIVPHLNLLQALCEYMRDRAIRAKGASCADEEFLAMKAALAALEAVSVPRLCTCGKCSQKPEAERMPDGAVAH